MARMTPISPVRSSTDIDMVLKMARAASMMMKNWMNPWMPSIIPTTDSHGSRWYQASTVVSPSPGAERRAATMGSSCRGSRPGP